MEIPEIKLSQPLIIGLAVTASILAIVLYYENRQLRKLLADGPPVVKKPCGCKEKEIESEEDNDPIVDA